MAPHGVGFKNSGVAPYVMSAKNLPDALKWMSFSLVVNDQASAAVVLKVKQLSLSLWKDETLKNEWVAFVCMSHWIAQRIR
jgi:hypothetical protein